MTEEEKSQFCANTYCRPSQSSSNGAEVMDHKGERKRAQQYSHVGVASASEYALAEL